jgi:hypothetical protein
MSWDRMEDTEMYNDIQKIIINDSDSLTLDYLCYEYLTMMSRLIKPPCFHSLLSDARYRVRTHLISYKSDAIDDHVHENDVRGNSSRKSHEVHRRAPLSSLIESGWNPLHNYEEVTRTRIRPT